MAIVLLGEVPAIPEASDGQEVPLVVGLCPLYFLMIRRFENGRTLQGENHATSAGNGISSANLSLYFGAKTICLH